MRRPLLIASAVAAALLIAGCNVRVSTDPFTNATSQHRTQVEPDTFSFGSTIVSTFQSGRFFDGGATDIGWATSTDGGSHWVEGFLPGITKYRGAGPYDRASDPSVAYDARHRVWLISSLGLVESPSPAGRAVVVSRSVDGLTWRNPATVATSTFLDKNWTVCDNAPGSASYGHCYTEYDDANAGDRLHIATSTDGGLTWVQATVPAANGLGGQPLVQPNGTVIVPYVSNAGTVAALRSTNGGTSYTGPVTIASLTQHLVAGSLRAPSLPSAEIDGAGKVYVVWADCRFRSTCSANDIVLSTSLNGTTWSAVTRVPIDPSTSKVDHFIPGLGVDSTTSGSSAHLALTYYYYPNASCASSSCQLDVGFVSSSNGGTSWSAASQLAGPMSLGWLARTNQGVMVGDYISTSFSGRKAFPVFTVAAAPRDGLFDEATYAVAGGRAVSGGGATSSADHVVSAPVEPSAPPFVTNY